MPEYDKKKSRYFSTAIQGDRWSIEDLLKKDPSLLNEIDETGLSAIMLAAENINDGVVDFLMHQPGIDLNVLSSDGLSLAHIAAYQKRLGWLEDLSKLGVSFTEEKMGQSYYLAECLLEGARSSAEDKVLTVLKFLVSRGANVSPDLKFGLFQKNTMELAADRGFLRVKAFLEEVNLAKSEKMALENILSSPKDQEKSEEHEEALEASRLKRSKPL